MVIVEYTGHSYKIYSLPKEVSVLIQELLTFDNPAYFAAAKFSKWGAPKNISSKLKYYNVGVENNNNSYIEVPYGFNFDILKDKIPAEEIKYVSYVSEHKGVDFPDFLLTLRETQREAAQNYIRSIKEGDFCHHSQIILPTGKGKAQPLYSKIMTPKGYTLMGDIQIGDEVFDSKGNICHVLGVYPQGKKKVYELTFSDGSKVRSSDEHLWFFQTRREYRNNEPFHVKTLKDIMNMDFKYDRSYNLIFPKNEAVKYRNVEHKIHPYVLGCLIGDGCMTSAYKGYIYFSNIEQDIIDRLNGKLVEGYFDFNKHTQCEYIYRIKGTSRNGSRVGGTLVQEIIRLGLNCKSGDKFIPKEYLLSSEKNRLELLYGLFDTDGSIMPNGSFIFSTTSKRLSEDLVYLCRGLGFITSLRFHSRGHEGKSDEYIVCIRTHKRIFTSKKHNERNEKAVLSHSGKNINKYDTLRLVSVKYIGEEDCQCIMVDSKDHSYLTDNFIVTHNTITALYIAAQLQKRTLVIVHKTDLVKVWREDVGKAFNVPCGLIQGKNFKIEEVTVATIQTLSRMQKNGNFSDYFRNMFDFIIIDEAHHCPASTYGVVDEFCAKYRLGLTATPERNDGLDHILNLFFGEPCYIYKNGGVEKDILPVDVKIRKVYLQYDPLVEIVNNKNDVTSIKLVSEYPNAFNALMEYTGMFFHLSNFVGEKIEFLDDNFNRQVIEKNIVCNKKTVEKVFEDLDFELCEGHSCVLFFKQKSEVDFYYEFIYKYLNVKDMSCVGKYYGDNTDEENNMVLKNIEEGKIKITLTTLAKCSEGTNVMAWDRAFLVSSIANGKDVEQVIGRIRRKMEGKEDAVVYDYNYFQTPFKYHIFKRLARYKKLNFKVENFNKIAGIFKR